MSLTCILSAHGAFICLRLLSLPAEHISRRRKSEWALRIATERISQLILALLGWYHTRPNMTFLVH